MASYVRGRWTIGYGQLCQREVNHRLWSAMPEGGEPSVMASYVRGRWTLVVILIILLKNLILHTDCKISTDILLLEVWIFVYISYPRTSTILCTVQCSAICDIALFRNITFDILICLYKLIQTWFNLHQWVNIFKSVFTLQQKYGSIRLIFISSFIL